MNKTLTQSALSVAVLLTVALAGTGCLKSNNSTSLLPVLTTRDVVKDAADTSAHSGGLITENSTDAITANGVCWSATNSTPTIADSKTADTVLNLYFRSRMKGLKVNTKYYARAYATNAAGTAYGSVVEFTTGSDLTSKVGTVSTFAGSAAAGFNNGTGSAASFYSPEGISIDASGNFYIADALNSAIRKMTGSGVVTTLTGNGTIGYIDGALADARFYAPQGSVTDATGNIYVADFSNNMIRKITPAGVVSTLAGSGTASYDDGTGANATFNNPRSIAIGADGNLYVADMGNNLIRKVTTAGVVTTFAGNRAATQVDNTTGTSASFNKPSGIAVDATGNLYVADAMNYAIRKISTTGAVITYLGDTRHKVLGTPSAISIDAKGNIFITDQTGRVFEITADKTLLTLAGASATTGFIDGAGKTAQFAGPTGVVADGNGNIYITDSGNNSIRKIALPTL